MKKEMLFLLLFVCICFCGAIQMTAEAPAGNGKDLAVKKEPLKARLSLSDDNIKRIIANDPRPLYLTVTPPIEVNVFWPNLEESGTVSRSNIGENESKTETAGNEASQESWTETDQQELNGLSIQVQCYTPPLMKVGGSEIEFFPKPDPKLEGEWAYREWMLRRIAELEKKRSRSGENINRGI